MSQQKQPKFIQITPAHVYDEEAGREYETLYALDESGQVWRTFKSTYSGVFVPWHRMPVERNNKPYPTGTL